MGFDAKDMKVAIFDMDGTLLDTMPYWRCTTLEYLLAHQWPVRSWVLEKMLGTSSRRLIREYAAAEGLPLDEAGLVPELEAFMNRHYLCDARVKAHAGEFLPLLKSRGVRMCVATGSPREYARNGLGRLGLLEHFEFVTDNYEGPWTKDRPEYFRWLLDRLGAEAGEAWVFEDALYAMRAAKAAGLRVCAIEDPSSEADRDGIRAVADAYIRDWRELMA